MSTPNKDFRGTERFEVRGRLGEGGMGVVYAAFDHQRGEAVALKTLHRASPGAIYRIKKEFRALAGVSHENLVRLYELVSDGGTFFFTMELLEGPHFLSWVRPDPSLSEEESEETTIYALAGAPPPRSTSIRTTAQRVVPQAPMTQPVPGASGTLEILAPSAELHEERLRAGLRQLAEGLVALHDAGKLHRDIKPSNVVVTPKGRVVLLDFGLATDVEEDSLYRSQQGVMGTAAYMAPELAVGEKATKAGDWYSVGVILYQALTGQLPFSGTVYKIVLEKQEREPTRPDALVPGLPPDLVELAMDLLRIEPKLRPNGRDVLRRLGGDAPRLDSPGLAWSAPSVAPAFIGRERHLAALFDAFAKTSGGRGAERVAVVQHVHGTSGIGKTALVRAFLDALEARTDALVLAGRCYERELVPYRALDSLVDVLSRHLLRQSPEVLETLLPADIGDLGRIFPVLDRVELVRRRRRAAREVSEPLEVRRRAFAAFRGLMAQLASLSPVVLFLDDLHWGDSDSAQLLGELLRPPAPPVLLLAVYRAEDRDSSPLLRRLRTTPEAGGHELSEIIVGPLEPAQAALLAQAALERGPDVEDDLRQARPEDLRTTRTALSTAEIRQRAAAIAEESGGNPLFIYELASHARAEAAPLGRAPSREAPLRLDEALGRRIQRLSREARALLEVLAVAGRPLRADLALLAAGLPAGDLAAPGQLSATHMARSRSTGEGQPELEVYHDHIRRAVRETMGEARLRERAKALADVLEAQLDLSPEQLVSYLREAGLQDRAAVAARAAAQRSRGQLAFEQAAALAEVALELTTDARQLYELRKDHAEILEEAGRPEAADAYLAAAEAARSEGAAREMRRRAAEQLLRTGRIAEGLAALRPVLKAAGFDLPGSPAVALSELRVERSRLLMRGLELTEVPLEALDRGLLARADACWTAGVGLTMVDVVTASTFTTRYLHLALEAGEPSRIARALAMELAFLTSEGKKSPTRMRRVLQLLETIATRSDAPYVRGFAALGAALAALHEGEWGQAERCAERSERILGAECTGVAWEIQTARTFGIWTRAYQGRFEGLTGRLGALIEAAVRERNLYAATILRTSANANIAWLAAGDVAAARHHLEEGKRASDQAGFYLAHFWELCSRLQLDLYAGDDERAWARVTKGWPSLVSSLVLRVQVLRVEALYLRARAALALAQQAPAPRPLLAAARADGERMMGENAPWAQALGRLIQAQVRRAIGLTSEAEDFYRDAIVGLEEAGMLTHAAAAEARWGDLIGGPAGKEQRKTAELKLKASGIADPARWVQMLAPGRG